MAKPEMVDVPLADLLVDTRNARLKDEQSSQQAAILALAQQQGHRLVRLASDIVMHGLDPTTLPAIVPTPDQKKRYLVIEGNRRILALKALETPSLVEAALDARGRSTLHKLSKRFAGGPISVVRCILFPSADSVQHWVTLRHTGQNDGVGLVEWGANEKDRWAARHGERSPAGQVLDFVHKSGLLSEQARDSDKPILTNLARLINSPYVRETIGIRKVDGQLVSEHDPQQIARALTRLVEDLLLERKNVNDIYYEHDRKKYVDELPLDLRPKSGAARLATWILGKPEDATRVSVAKSIVDKRPKKHAKDTPRTALIPKTCRLNIAPPRINTIYNELLTLSGDQYPNACSVILRVFLELSIDHYLEQNGSLMTEVERRGTPLAKRLKVVAKHLESVGRISGQLYQAIQRIADNQAILAASVPTFNLYVHNPYVFPRPSELRVAWDELQPLLEVLWA